MRLWVSGEHSLLSHWQHFVLLIRRIQWLGITLSPFLPLADAMMKNLVPDFATYQYGLPLKAIPLALWL